MSTISWEDFEKIDLRVGKIIRVESFPKARKPAYQLWVNFGTSIGIKKSSAQITELYSQEDLLNKLVLGVVNFPPKQIGPFLSECLITGFYNKKNEVVLAIPEQDIEIGSKLQ